MTRAALLVLALLAAGCAAPAADLAPQAAAPDAPALPDVLPQVVRSVQVDARWSGEPSILALADGTLLVTGAGGMTRYVEDPTAIPGQFGQSYLWRSADGGATWDFVDLGLPDPTARHLHYRNAILGVEGDLAQDEAGRAYFVDLAALVADGLSASDDSGRTWTAVQNPLVGQPGVDRPWVAAVGDGEVFVKYLQMGSGHRVARSTDGGLTFLEDVELPPCGQADMTVDLAARHVLVACAEGDALSFVRTAAEGPMAWEKVDVLQAEGNASNVFVSMAVAGEGEYVFAWSERTEEGARLRVSASLDAGKTWSEPRTLSAGTAVFPWVDANADGVVGVVWYETLAMGAPDEVDGEWYPVHASMRLDEGGLALLSTTRLSEEPVHEGAICTSGLGCVLDGRSEERRLLDFFEVDVDAAGASHVAWTSTRTPSPTVWYGQVAAP